MVTQQLLLTRIDLEWFVFGSFKEHNIDNNQERPLELLSLRLGIKV